MPVNRTSPTVDRPVSLAMGLHCAACGMRTVGVRECHCCGDFWLVCDVCEAAHGRLVESR